MQVEAARHLSIGTGGCAPAADTVPPGDPPRPDIEPVDVAVVGAGAAGLYTALVAAANGARVALISQLAARPVRELLGAGRPRGGARSRRHRRAPPRRHARAGRGATSAPHGARPLRGGARPRAGAGAARDLVRPFAGGSAVAVARGRPHPPPRRARGRQRDRQARDGEALRAGHRRRPDRGARAHLRARAVGGRWSLHRSRDRVGRHPGRRNRARDRRRRCAVAAHHQPARARSARGCRWRIEAGAALADLEFMQFHPTALARTESWTGSSSPRPCAAKARCS